MSPLGQGSPDSAAKRSQSLKARLVEGQKQPQGIVYLPLLRRRNVPNQLPEAARVHGTQLFDENPGRLIVDLDLGSKGRGARSLRCGGDDHYRASDGV